MNALRILVFTASLLFSFAICAHAQIGAFGSGLPHRVRVDVAPAQKLPTRPLATGFQFYDETLPTVDWIGHGIYGPYVTVILGERFTMPLIPTDFDGQAGWVDSVSVMLDSVTQDSVTIALLPDTLYDLGSAQYHLINIFDPNAPIYGQATVQAKDVHRGQWTTVHFPHVPVPWNFFVGVIPTITDQGAITNAFWLRGDVRTRVPRDQENSRSGFVAAITQTGQEFSALLDSAFIPSGYTEPVSSNLYITLYATSPSGGVAMGHDAENVTLAPNPAASFVRAEGVTSPTSIRIIDMLGREMLNTTILDRSQINVERLPAGRYTAIVKSKDGTSAHSLVIQH